MTKCAGFFTTQSVLCVKLRVMVGECVSLSYGGRHHHTTFLALFSRQLPVGGCVGLGFESGCGRCGLGVRVRLWPMWARGSSPAVGCSSLAGVICHVLVWVVALKRLGCF